MTYRKVRTLNQADAGYIAGLIDGEGTITLTRKHANERRGLAVTISNTERTILQYVLNAIGVGTITNKRAAKANHTPSYTLQVWNRQALALLQQIRPLLKSYKASRANLVLIDYLRLTSRNGRYTERQLAEREEFVRRFFAIRPSLVGGRPGPTLR